MKTKSDWNCEKLVVRNTNIISIYIGMLSEVDTFYQGVALMIPEYYSNLTICFYSLETEIKIISMKCIQVDLHSLLLSLEEF